MTVLLDAHAVEGVLGMRDAIDLLEQAFAHEAAGATFVSPKFVSEFEQGAMRVLFAADRAADRAAMKAYHNVTGVGTRYVVTLYSLRTGEVLAVMDGRVITDLRTGAASGVAARRVAVAGDVTVGVIGAGNQARAQLEALAAVYRVKGAAVYSPTPANREAYAVEMSDRLGFPVAAAASLEAAVRGRSVVATASSARTSEPFLRGEWLGECRLLCAVGNTRAAYAEIDEQCIRAASLVVVDSEHALHEAGEMRRAVAAGALPGEKRAPLARLVAGTVSVPRDGMVVFKSVGSALQDLALASRCYDLLKGAGSSPDVASLRGKRGTA
ncbi:MAG: ornithine cyclodeaminase family protein [Burkholderiales bacterium]|nr:ornithine cyclodeaminase family protein [Burkholderiales bacterium]